MRACVRACVCVCVHARTGTAVFYFHMQWKMFNLPRLDCVRQALGKPVIHCGYFYSFFVQGESSYTSRMPGFGHYQTLSLFRTKVGLDILNEAWQPVTLPSGHWSVSEAPQAFIFSGDIFIILIGTSASGGNSHIFRFEEASSWKSVSCFPRPLLLYAVAVLDHTLLVIGGKDSQTDKASESVHALDLLHPGGEWSTFDSPCVCLLPVVTAWDTYVHVFAKEETSVASIDSSALEGERKWSYDVLPPVPSIVECAAVVNGHLVVATGRDTYGVSALMYIPECRRYLPLQECNAERGSAVVALSNKLCLAKCSLNGKVVRFYMLSAVQ